MSPRRLLTFDRAVQQWLNYLQDESGATPRTIDSYEKVLGYVRDVLGPDIDPLSINRDDLQDCLAAWRNVSSSTRATRISIMRSFFDWLEDTDHARKARDYENPARRLKRPRTSRPARRRLTRSDIEAMLAAAKRPDDQLVTMLLALTGIRRSELLGLRWRDVDLAERTLRVVKGKGGKGREVPLPEPLARLLRDRRARLAEHGNISSDHIVQGRAGGRMGDATPNHILARVAGLAGIDDAEHVGPHDLRRAYATIFQRANPGDLVRLQAVMGHADISTTRVYIADAEQRSIRTAADAAFGDFVAGDLPAFGALPELPAPSEDSRPDSSARMSTPDEATNSERSERGGGLVTPGEEA